MNPTNHTDMFLGASKEIFETARILRNHMTIPEKILWEKLKYYKLYGFKFRRQHPIADYVADFYCHKARLIIEIDGNNHQHQSAKDKDLARTEYLNQFDINVIRFTNEAVTKTLAEVLKKIDLELQSISNFTPKSPEGDL